MNYSNVSLEPMVGDCVRLKSSATIDTVKYTDGFRRDGVIYLEHHGTALLVCVEFLERPTVAGGGSTKLEVGRYYKRRDGVVVGPVSASEDYNYPFRHSVNIYTEAGKFSRLGFFPYSDLIALVPPPTAKQEVTLEELVARYEAARAALQPFKDKLEERSVPASIWYRACGPVGMEVRVKPAPAFQLKLLSGETCDVVVDGEGVKIGCSCFSVAVLIQNLEVSLVDDRYVEAANDMDIQASRKGIHHRKGGVSWEEAERLLTFLQGEAK